MKIAIFILFLCLLLGKNDKSCYIVEISKEYVYELLNGKTG